jgi:hypothetical protein
MHELKNIGENNDEKNKETIQETLKFNKYLAVALGAVGGGLSGITNRGN